MSQVRTHCGLRPGDDVKDMMTKATDVDRKNGETLSMYMSRCQQDWFVAASSGVCVHPYNMKVHLLRKGAHLTDPQVDQYNMMMMDREWELDWAIRAYHAIDLSASETDGRKT